MRVLFTIILIVAWSCQVCAQDVKVQWDRNSEADLVGYKVYNGHSMPPGVLKATLGKQLNRYTFSNLTGTTPYYFAVTAYNTSGNESLLSNVVSSGLYTRINAVARSTTTQSITLTCSVPATIRYCVVNGTAACTPSVVYSAAFRVPVNVAAQTVCVSATATVGGEVEGVHCQTIRKQALR